MICRWYRSFGTEKQEGWRTRAFSVGHICTQYSVGSVYFQSVQDLFLLVFCPLKCQEVHSRIRFFAISSLLHSSHFFPQIIECLFFLFKPRQKAQGSVYTHCTCMHPRGLGRSYHIFFFLPKYRLFLHERCLNSFHDVTSSVYVRKNSTTT